MAYSEESTEEANSEEPKEELNSEEKKEAPQSDKALPELTPSVLKFHQGKNLPKKDADAQAFKEPSWFDDQTNLVVLSDNSSSQTWDDNALLLAQFDFSLGYVVPQEPSGQAQQSTVVFDRAYLYSQMSQGIGYAGIRWDLLSLGMERDSEESFYTQNNVVAGISYEGVNLYIGLLNVPLFEAVTTYWMPSRILNGYNLLSNDSDFFLARDLGLGVRYAYDLFHVKFHIMNGEGGLKTEPGVFKDFNLFLGYNVNSSDFPQDANTKVTGLIAFLEGSFGSFDQVTIENNTKTRTSLGLGYQYKGIQALVMTSQTEESVDGFNLWKEDHIDLNSIGGQKNKRSLVGGYLSAVYKKYLVQLISETYNGSETLQNKTAHSFGMGLYYKISPRITAGIGTHSIEYSGSYSNEATDQKSAFGLIRASFPIGNE